MDINNCRALIALILSSSAAGVVQAQFSEIVLAQQTQLYNDNYTGLFAPLSVAPNGFATTSVTLVADSEEEGLWVALPSGSSSAFFKSFGNPPIGNCNHQWNINSDGTLFDGYNFWPYNSSSATATFGQIGVRPIAGQCPWERCNSYGGGCVLGSIDNWIWWLADGGEAVSVMAGFADGIDPASAILFHRAVDGTLSRVAQDVAVTGVISQGYPFDSPRTNSSGMIVVPISGTGEVLSYTWNGSDYVATDVVYPGESNLCSIDPANFFLAEDGTVAFIGQWSGDSCNTSGPAIFVKRTGEAMRVFFPPAYPEFIGVQSATFSASGVAKKLRWCIYGRGVDSTRRSVGYLWGGLDMLNDIPSSSTIEDWASVELARATSLDITQSPPTVGIEGEVFSWDGVDSLGRVNFVQGIDDRSTLSESGVVRTYQFVRLSFDRSCPADFNEDGMVDDADWVIFFGEYDKLTIPPAHPACDLNGDGVVDDSDFAIFAVAYNELVCPS